MNSLEGAFPDRMLQSEICLLLRLSLRLAVIWLKHLFLMSSQSRIELYKEAMSIEHERAALQAKIDQLQARLENIKGSLFSATGAVNVPAAVKIKATATVVRPASAGRKPRAARGELKQRILDALAAAGSAGIRIRDLADSIGSKPASLHSWFQFADRKSVV